RSSWLRIPTSTCLHCAGGAKDTAPEQKQLLLIAPEVGKAHAAPVGRGIGGGALHPVPSVQGPRVVHRDVTGYVPPEQQDVVLVRVVHDPLPVSSGGLVRGGERVPLGAVP